MHPKLKDFHDAVLRLQEVLEEHKNDYIRDSAIKRFELCFDLSWKVIKLCAKKEGVECFSPRSCFKAGFQLKLYKYNDEWLTMIEDRNKSVHLYEESMADDVYEKLPVYLKLFKVLLRNARKKMKDQ